MNPGAKGGTFFRTMVLMGSSVAMSCGGMTQADGSGGSSSSGGGPNSGGSGGAGSGGASGGSVGSGGRLPVGSGGGLVVGTGGEGNDNFGGAFPTDCPTAQLDCPTPNGSGCSQYDHGYLILPGNCLCESERPESADDCAANEGFTCQVASEDAYGRQLDPPVMFNCECIVQQPSSSADCFGFCAEHSQSSPISYCTDPGEITEDLQAFLCGCAMTLLK